MHKTLNVQCKIHAKCEKFKVLAMLIPEVERYYHPNYISSYQKYTSA